MVVKSTLHIGLIFQGENMDGTILGQGSFIVPSTFNQTTNPINQIIQIPSAADWLEVRNYTNAGKVGGATGLGVEYYWQRGMAPGTGMVEYYGNGTAVKSGDTLVSGGFTIYDPTGQQVGSQPLLGSPVVVSAVTNQAQPVVTHAADTSVVVGSVVRLSNTAQTDVNGIDFVVGAVADSTHFTLLTASNALATLPGAIGGAGFYRVVTYPPLFYPARKIVTNVTKSATVAQVSTAIEHSYTVGQAVRFNIPSVSGMVQLNTTGANQYMYSTVTSIVDAYNFTIDTNTLSFTTFTWPTIAQQPSSFTTVEPIGENTAFALNSNLGQFPQYQGLNVFNANGGVFADATVNTGYYGMVLGTGGVGTVAGALAISGPAGTTAGDVVYWKCGKSEFGGL